MVHGIEYVVQTIGSMAVSIDWGSFKGNYGPPRKRFGIDIRQV